MGLLLLDSGAGKKAIAFWRKARRTNLRPMTRKRYFFRVKHRTDYRVMNISRLWSLGFKICLVVGTATLRRVSRVHVSFLDRRDNRFLVTVTVFVLLRAHLRRGDGRRGDGSRLRQTRKTTRTQDNRDEENGCRFGEESVHIIPYVG